MQHDVPVIKSISFFGTVTNSDAAAVACLNVITGMKGRILIKTISPHTFFPPPYSNNELGAVFFSVGVFLICAFLLRNTSNHQTVAYYIMTMPPHTHSHPDESWLKAWVCAEWESDTFTVSNGSLALYKPI